MFRQVRTFAAKAKVKAKTKPQGPPTRRGDSREAPATLAEKRAISLLRPVPPPPPFTAEERARLRARMIRYGKLKRREHLEVERKLNRFKWAKWAAMDALPNHRRVEALETPAPERPSNVPLWTDTPPIKGFNVGDIKK